MNTVTDSIQQSFEYGDSVSCAVKGSEKFPSPPQCVLRQTCNKVTYTDRSICAIKGSSVDISCTYSHYYYDNDDDVVSKFWFSPDRSRQWMNPSQPEDLSKDSQYSGRVQVLEPETRRSTLRITNLTESDSSEYHFKFKTPRFEWRSVLPGTTLTVTALQVQVTRIISVHQSQTKAELKCLSSCGPAGRLYVWFKNQQRIRTQQTSTLTDNFSAGDTVSCAFSGHEDYRSPSVYPSKLSPISVSPSGEIVEGSSVTLTCSSDANPAANFTWYKGNQPLPLGPGGIYRFTSISSEDRGIYYCKSEDQQSVSVFIDVQYPPKLPSVSVSPSGEIVEGSSVTLTCSSDANPAANYTWYKENQTLSQGSDGVHAFISISSNNRGNYYCKSENQYGYSKSSSLFIDVQYPPKLPSVSVSPSGEIMEGSSVTLTCSSDANPAANYTWYKGNQPLPLGPGCIYHFTSISSEDRGIYYCKSEDQQSVSVFIDVQYPPKLPFVSVSPSGEIVEGSSVTLTCSSDANPAANYIWYKENQTLSQGSDGVHAFISISSNNRGNYYCKSENQYGYSKSSSLFIDVQY
ncbi:B-cell receptor CD22-like [Mugil cephalus]|uniref:B-cell receptor CD22-like n=1 Tax=Mugil cephalus TaxID=48193 RepID=UPI001FB69886|nr:B-cell receptor CD22-like [Mugil cephalus]